MDESRYSADSKGDYVGALSTRLRSLTNGIYGQIFSSRELSSEELFDKNVIVDLSRVGSVETKSLIMGLLVLKMQEYRMASSKTTNRALRHVTVLEEAHNLLKRTSAEQSSEGANLLGKSVEMLANAVAEMRTYGEGFIIADQAPGLLDMSVIRNTNTKIILRLPDMEDRVLVGRAAALNDSRIEELSRLRTGVAAIYQNNWEEAVLCKISRAESKERPYSYEKKKGDRAPVSQMLLLEYLLVPVAKRSEFDRNRLKIMKNSLIRMDLPAHTKKDVLRYIEETDERISERLRARIVYDFFNTQTALAYASGEVMSAEAWYGIMEKKLVPDITGLGDAARGWIISAIAKEQAERTGAADDARLFEELVDYVRRRG